MKVNDLTITTPAVFDYTTIVQNDWSISHVYFRKLSITFDQKCGQG